MQKLLDMVLRENSKYHGKEDRVRYFPIANTIWKEQVFKAGCGENDVNFYDRVTHGNE